VVELSGFLRNANPALAVDVKFRSPEAVNRKLEDLRSARPGYAGKATKGGRATADIARAAVEDEARLLHLAELIRANPELLEIVDRSRYIDDIDVDRFVDLDAVEHQQALSAIEGAVGHRWAQVRERNPKLRREKLRQARANGSLACETCGFDFAMVYGDLGEGYIHVHHRVPLHVTNEVKNTLADLILLCANCHSMIHRKVPWKTPEELVEIIGAAR
jgi:5-methylcytosine-specific restriction protein A